MDELDRECLPEGLGLGRVGMLDSRVSLSTFLLWDHFRVESCFLLRVRPLGWKDSLGMPRLSNPVSDTPPEPPVSIPSACETRAVRSRHSHSPVLLMSEVDRFCCC